MHHSTKQSWWSDLARAAAGCAAFALLVSATGVRAAEQAATNIDLMQDLTAAVVQELHSRFAPVLNGRSVRLKPASNSEEYYFVTNVFREELTRLGVVTLEPTTPLTLAGATPDTKTTPAGADPSTSASALLSQPQNQPNAAVTDSATGAPLVLQYQTVVFDLDYVDSHRAFVVGGKRVDRRAGVRIMATLTDPSGQVVWVGEAARDHEDEIDYGDAARLEQGVYKFNAPVVPSGGWGKVVEPVFVTGVIVGLIYLFFSNQSDN